MTRAILPTRTENAWALRAAICANESSGNAQCPPYDRAVAACRLASQYRFAIGNSSAGNSVITRQPLSVTTTSSSMRAAE